MNFKQEALEEMKKNFTLDELETIDILSSGNLKYNSIKKFHLETFKKVIHYLSGRLSWNVDEEIFDDQTKTQTQNTLLDRLYRTPDFQKNVLIILTAFPLEFENKQ